MVRTGLTLVFHLLVLGRFNFDIFRIELIGRFLSHDEGAVGLRVVVRIKQIFEFFLDFPVFVLDGNLPEFGHFVFFVEAVGKTELSKGQAYCKMWLKLLIIKPIVYPENIFWQQHGGHHGVNLLISEIMYEDFLDRNEPANTVIITWGIKLPFIDFVKSGLGTTHFNIFLFLETRVILLLF